MITHSQVFEKAFISIEQVRKDAPSAFTQRPSSQASNDYVLIPTPDILNNLASVGWFPIKAYQVTPKKKTNEGFQKHFIKLRNAKYFVGTKSNIQTVPELLLVNSYDARCSVKFFITLNRVAIDNAIVIKSDLLFDSDGREKLRLAHKGEKTIDLPDVEDDYTKLLNLIPQCVDLSLELSNSLAQVDLSVEQRKKFAQECCRARWDYTYNLRNTSSLLDPWREEDQKNDLLTLTYRMNEKMVRGKWIGAGGRSIKALSDPNRELNVTAKLFQIAEEYYYQLQH